MIIIGERLNSSRKSVLKAFQNKDEQFIISEARKQKEAGADYLDVNTAMMKEEEVKTLKWVIPLIQNEIDIPIAIDTPNPVAMEAGLKSHKGRALINSINGKKQELEEFIPLIGKYNAKAVIMCLDDSGLLKPKPVLTRVQIAMKILDKIKAGGIKFDDVFVDPMVQPIGIDANNGVVSLDSLRLLKNFLPSIKTIAGISNVSFGMPGRQLLNRIFLALAIQIGLDAAILDPLDENIMETLLAAKTLLGKDPSCKEYIDHMRKRSKK